MAESLPSRAIIKHELIVCATSLPIADVAHAYASGELKTEAEWRESIDWEAAALALHNASAEQDDTFDAAHSVVDAAFEGV